MALHENQNDASDRSGKLHKFMVAKIRHPGSKAFMISSVYAPGIPPNVIIVCEKTPADPYNLYYEVFQTWI